ncbi:general transcription factor IIE subunit 1 isoform X2 [Tamandua tetradactyla]|uniref:general transcription factor IIE subunit 1 isoform X2 n=1 Tax=Tamandua tetradactyla TaxID=48850 RepID=UPI004053BFDF
MADPDVLTEVPAALKRLAKYVIRGFYGIEHALALDILIRNPCVKEEDMLELLKFDRKQLRCWCYSGPVFITLDRSGRCYPAPQGTFRCTFCQTEVEEDESAMPKKDARTLLARFNEQIEPIYALLRETEDVNLAYEILEPEPTEIPALKQSKDRSAIAAGAAGLAGGHHREAWATKGPSYEDLYTQNVVINMDDQEDLHRASVEGKSAKERPIWLRESTVQGAYSSEEMKEGGIDIDAFQENEEGRAGPDDNEEVMRALLIHEKKTPSAIAGSVGAAAPVTTANGSDSESETSESDDDSPPRPAAVVGHHQDEEEEDDEFEEVADDPVVMVAGRPFSYSEVSQRPELVAQMTPEEKEAYIAMGQRMFEDLFE